MNISSSRTALCLVVFFASLSAHAQEKAGPGVSRLDVVQVTATRFGTPVQEIPGALNVISGEEMRARGVNDLRSALALLGGVTVAPGGDDGPAGAVPGLLGLRESDDFLLVVDGVPAGGTFVPQFSTLNLNNVERIEVQRGAAPVFYGTTAFAGTINVIHYPAGKAEPEAGVTYGSFGSLSVNAARIISAEGVRQSLSADATRDRFSDPRASAEREHVNYRLATEAGGGDARLDLDATRLRQKPASPTPLQERALTTLLPVDFNQNPADARLDTDRFALTTGYDRKVGLNAWSSTLAVTHTRTRSIRGFLVEDFQGATDTNARGFDQTRTLNDVFFDSHITSRWGESLTVTYGLNELYGRASQDSRTFDYTVPLDGTLPPASSSVSQNESSFLKDTRSFFGFFSQARWQVNRDFGVLGGLRWNHTSENRTTGVADDSTTRRALNTRLSGSLGINWRVWQDAQGDLDDVVLYASAGNTFQPPQIDFGPDAGDNALLKPETEKSSEFGVKADGLDGRLELDVAAFFVDFNNQPITTSVNGLPALANGGRQRFKGAEVELAYRPTSNLIFSANYSYNDVRYRDFETLIGNAFVQLAGDRIPLSPRDLAAVGVTYSAAQGFRASLTANYVGERFLDMQNTIRTGSYVTTDATVGYRFHGYSITLAGYNLSNRRDPVHASELGEGQFYRLPGRRLLVRLSTSL